MFGHGAVKRGGVHLVEPAAEAAGGEGAGGLAPLHDGPHDGGEHRGAGRAAAAEVVDGVQEAGGQDNDGGGAGAGVWGKLFTPLSNHTAGVGGSVSGVPPGKLSQLVRGRIFPGGGRAGSRRGCL